MLKPARLKNYTLEHRLFSTRMFIACGFMVLTTSILIARMHHLQITDYSVHTTQSEKNRIKVQPLPPNRGLIYDRNGTLLAENRPSHLVSIIRERVDNIDETLQQIQSRINITPSELETFKQRFNGPRTPFLPIPLKLNLNEQEIAKLAVDQHKIPSMEISATLSRFYPKGAAVGHALGYVGRINTKDEARIDPVAYAGTNLIGKTGLEAYYEDSLHGKVGYQKVEVNARGRILKVLEQHDPKPGQDLHLHLDLATQLAAIKAMQEYNGSVVAIDPKTGGIIAFVSKPAYDPNLFVQGIGHAAFATLNSDPNRPLFNRAIKGQYPPGSTLKPITALAALETQVTDWTWEIEDPGFYQLENDPHRYRDWKRQGHGRVNLSKAITESCDTYYYIIARKMGIDVMRDQLVRFALGELTHIDLPGEKPGLIPSKAWKRARHGQPWYPGETLIAGIGQGFMLTTPLQLAVSTAVLANRGTPVQPSMVSTLGHASNANPTPSLKLPPVKLSNTEDWNRVVTAMIDVVHSTRGTARGISKDLSYQIAGKTGTSQVIAIAQGEEYDEDNIAKIHRDHALFVAFAPADNPTIALAVIAENAGSGGSVAAPIARKVFDAFLLPRLDELAPEPTPTSDTTPQA